MIKTILFPTLLVGSSMAVAVAAEECTTAAFGQCNTDDGDLCCPDNQKCFKQNEWWSQCLDACPLANGWECAGGKTASPTTKYVVEQDEDGCVASFGQCNGDDGDYCCAEPGQQCFKHNAWFSQCLDACPIGEGWECDTSGTTKSPTSKYVPETDENGCVSEFEQCNEYCCQDGLKCFEQHEWYSQCLQACPEGWACNVHVDAAEVEIGEDERLVVTYAFSDRCENYALDSCVNPAPVDDEDDATVAPYRGTRSVEGVWYFSDTVTYEKDLHSLKVSITFGHDPLNANRKRVLMMKLDQSEYLEYDEVIQTDEDGEQYVSWTSCTTIVPEELPQQVMKAMEGLSAGRRRLLSDAHQPLLGDSVLDESARTFHSYVRRTLLGFGHVHINIPHDKYQHLNNVLNNGEGRTNPGRRMLEDEAEEDEYYDVEEEDDGVYDADDEVLSFEPPLTNEGASGHMLMQSVDDVLQAGDFTEEEAEEMMANFTSGVYLSVDSDGSDSFIPKSMIHNTSEEIVSGLIVWPENVTSECVEELEGYEDGIPSRHDLDSVLIPEEDDDQTDTGSRRLLSLRQAMKKSQQAKAEGQHKTKAAQRMAQQLQEARAGSAMAKTSTTTTTTRRHLAATTSSCDADLTSWEEKRAAAGMDDDTWTGASYYDPATEECTSLRDEVVRLYDDFSDLAKGPDSVMGMLDARATEVMENVQFAQDLESDLKKLETTMTTTEIVLKMMSPLPYIGGVMKTLGNGVKKAKSAVITPTKTHLVSFNNKLESSQIETRACQLSVQNDRLATQLFNATEIYNKAVSPVLYVDNVCTDQLPLQDMCQPWAELHEPVNDLIDDFKKEAQSISDAMELPANVLGEAADLLSNAAYTEMTSFFDGLGAVLSPVTDLLNKKISVSVPMPTIKSKRVCAKVSYPCGVKMCKKRKKIFGRKFTIRYPCGVNTCSKTMCADVRYPTFVMRTFSFTVSDLISGVLSIVDFVMDAFTDLIEGMVKALGLPGFPSVENLLPGFPSFGVDVPSLPDLPSLPALPEQPSFLPEVELSGSCELASASCATDLTSCSVGIECNAMEGLEVEHVMSGLGYSAAASALVEVTPTIDMEISKQDGFQGTFVVPLGMSATFDLEISAAIDEEIEVNIGEPITMQQSLPVGPVPLIVSFAMQPKLLGHLIADAAAGTVSATLTCSAELMLDTADMTHLTMEDPSCVYEVNHELEVSASMQVEVAVAVDIDVAINDVGLTVTPQILLSLGSSLEEDLTAEALVDVTTVLGVPAWVEDELAQLGTTACAATFELARSHADFEASDCLLTLAEDAVQPLCEDMNELFAMEFPPDAVPTVDIWSKDLLAEESEDEGDAAP